MEQRTIRLNFDLSFVYGPRTWRAPIVVVMLLAAVGDLNSESVTLSTYYPAPSGVYTNMITTGDTRLARDGSIVTVGNGTSLSKLGVNGGLAVGTYATAFAAPANSMIVSGQVGIGTPTPTAGQALDVTGNVSVAGYVKISAVGCGAAQETDVTGNVGPVYGGGSICGGTQYATFTPGFYIVGTSYQNRGGAVLVEGAAGKRSTQVWGLDNCSGGGTGCSGNAAWMTLKKDDSSARIFCCPR